MSNTKDYDLVPTATAGLAAAYSGTTICQFSTFTDVTISNVKVKLEARFADMYDRSVIVTASTSGGQTVSATITYPAEASPAYYLAQGLSITAHTGETIEIKVASSTQREENWLFWPGGNITDDTAYIFGVAGSFASQIVRECACSFTASTLTDTWDIDDGYAYSALYPEPADWQGFEKDEFGYPTNWGVWKLDSSNEGYPWVTGYEDAIIRGLPVKIKSNDAWMPVLTKIFSADSLSTVFLKTMEEGDLTL